MAPSRPPSLAYGSAPPVPVAIIGSSIELPGGITDRERFLEVIREKVQVRVKHDVLTILEGLRI